jgi:hypothetical protein
MNIPSTNTRNMSSTNRLQRLLEHRTPQKTTRLCFPARLALRAAAVLPNRAKNSHEIQRASGETHALDSSAPSGAVDVIAAATIAAVEAGGPIAAVDVPAEARGSNGVREDRRHAAVIKVAIPARHGVRN